MMSLTQFLNLPIPVISIKVDEVSGQMDCFLITLLEVIPHDKMTWTKLVNLPTSLMVLAVDIMLRSLIRFL